ncbi:pectinesterase family protein [Flavisericum labens]|uniref:pectinesterase family protein n=1 Tax=Flavisericum labens TaxID=3377112 RepID=UPI00387B3602
MKQKHSLHFIFYLFIFSCNLLFAIEKKEIIVAQDGSGDFSSIQEAVTACGAFSEEEKTIYIKNGVYKEKVLIDSFHSNITLIGESNKETIIVYGDHVGRQGIGTFTSYTLKILGDNIKIENIKVENSSGPVGQAVALHVEGDYFVAKKCRFIGHQDTLYASGKNSRQYFIDCYISGTTDFIFGAATAIFNQCEIHSKSNSFITAANTPRERDFGYVFLNCNLTADKNVDKVYLGRPWRSYAKVVFIDCTMGKHIVSEGWHNWGKPQRQATVYYAEYGSKGEGANIKERVAWSHILTEKEIKEYNINNIFKITSKWTLLKGFTQ